MNPRNTKLEELLAKRAELDQQIESLRREQAQEAVRYIREQMALYNLTWMDIEGRQRAPRSDRGVPRKRQAIIAKKTAPKAAKKAPGKQAKRVAKG